MTRLCVRLAVLAAMLVALAIGLVALRTETNQAGNRLHALFRQKRDLEKACCGLELSIARLKNQERMREQAAGLREEGTGGAGGAEGEKPSRRGAATRDGGTARQRLPSG